MVKRLAIYILNKTNLFVVLAANFSKLFAELEETQQAIVKGIKSNKELLQGVQKAFVENNENVNKEIQKLETRVAGITSKK